MGMGPSVSTLILVQVLGGVPISTTAAPAHANHCAQFTLMQCYNEIYGELRDRRDYFKAHPADALALAAHWDNAYRKKYAALKNQPNAIKDADRIVDEIKETMNPTTWAKDNVLDELFKRYWPTLAKLARFAPAVEFARISLTPSETASDKDNLTLLNTNIQNALTNIISPGLKDNWLSEYQGIAKRVLTTSTGVPGPEIKPPR